MRDDPIIRSLENTGLPPWGREQPVCPVCGEGCDTIYRNADGDRILKCDAYKPIKRGRRDDT